MKMERDAQIPEVCSLEGEGPWLQRVRAPGTVPKRLSREQAFRSRREGMPEQLSAFRP